MSDNNRFTDLFADADAAFSGLYQNELSQLMGLSQSDIEAITPETTAMATYSKLIKVVEQASKDNISQADLITNIKSLGDIAIKISGKVPTLASLF
jgi:hypothetical protein